MTWVLYLALLLVMILGWVVNILGLPGLWLMVAAYGGFALATGFGVYVGWSSLFVMVLLGVLAEIVEFVAGAVGSKQAGGRKRGMIGAIVGGFLGAIFLSIIPIPIVAQVVGACLGAFIGAAVMELTDKDVAHSFRVGVGAAKGRFYGIVSKLLFGGVMFIVGALAGLPIGAAPPSPIAPPAPAIPATAPATSPATTPATTGSIG